MLSGQLGSNPNSPPPGVNPSDWDKVMQWLKNQGQNAANYEKNTFRPGLASFVDPSTSRIASIAGHRGTGAAIAGIGALSQGQDAGGVIGSIAAPLAFGGMANTAIDSLMKAAPGPYGKLGALALKIGATAIALPLAGSAIGSGVQDIAGKFMEPVNKAGSQGLETRAQGVLNPGSTSNRATQAQQAIIDQYKAYQALQKSAGMDVNDVEVDRYNRIINPLLDKQAQLRMQMMPVDVAARMAVNAGQSLGNMYERSIAGTSGIAQQIAANNPYGQVMV